VDACDARGRTPLHHAVAAGSAELVRYLLHHGADAELRDADDRVAEDCLGDVTLSDAALGGEEARAAVLGALRDPTLRLVAKAKSANGLYRAGEFAAATAAYETALQIAADAPEACTDQDLATLHFNCARAALKEGRHLTALVQAASALERRADYANARMLQAECHMELAEFSEAAAAYAALCRIEPHNPAWAECRLKASDMAEASLYDLLGVPPSAEPAELKKAYHHQCLRWHPDKHQGSAEAQRRANNIFQRVTNAYEVLGGDVRRAEYDLQLQLRKLRQGAYDTAPPAFDPYHYAKENVPAGGFDPTTFSKQPSKEAARQHAAAPYDNVPVDRASGAAARAFYEAFAAAEEGHRPAYHHRWSAYATNLFEADIDH